MLNDKKVTSYRLPVDTLQKLDKLLVVLNDRQREASKEAGVKFSRLTKADVIEYLVDREFYVYFDSNL